MVIVAGHLIVDADRREEYLTGCRPVVAQARAADGCLDFAIGADLVDPERINIYERWSSQAAVEAFRGAGPSDEQNVQMRSAAVAEYDIGDTRSLS